MPKVFQVRVLVEVEDDIPDPEELDWDAVVSNLPEGMRGFFIINAEIQPFTSLEDVSPDQPVH